jgi:hypothetical protein
MDASGAIPCFALRSHPSLDHPKQHAPSPCHTTASLVGRDRCHNTSSCFTQLGAWPHTIPARKFRCCLVFEEGHVPFARLGGSAGRVCSKTFLAASGASASPCQHRSRARTPRARFALLPPPPPARPASQMPADTPQHRSRRRAAAARESAQVAREQTGINPSSDKSRSSSSRRASQGQRRRRGRSRYCGGDAFYLRSAEQSS